MKHTLHCLAAAAALGAALCGCDNSNSGAAPAPQGASQQQAAAPAGTAPSGSSFVPGQRPAPAPAGAKVPLDRSTAEAAINSYLQRLAAGDFSGAVEACKPGSPGAEELKTMAANIEGMLASANDRSTAELAVTLLVQDVKSASVKKLTESETDAVFEVAVINKSPDNIMVVKEADGWYVVPPTSQGMPGMKSIPSG